MTKNKITVKTGGNRLATASFRHQSWRKKTHSGKYFMTADREAGASSESQSTKKAPATTTMSTKKNPPSAVSCDEKQKNWWQELGQLILLALIPLALFLLIWLIYSQYLSLTTEIIF